MTKTKEAKQNKAPSKTKERWKAFKTLVAMQLKERLSFSFKADKKGALTKLILLGVMFAAITVVIYFVIYILGTIGVLGTGGIPVPMFNIILYMIMILNVLSCIHRMTKSLYFSKDNQILLTYPVNNGVIFLSKMAVFYVEELMKNFVMIVPLLLAYGITYSFPLYFYPWLVFIFFFITLIPVAIGAVLSMPYMYILSFIKKSQYIQSILAIVFLITISVLLFIGLSKIPPDLKIVSNWTTYWRSIIDATQTVERYSGPLFYIAALIYGYRGYVYTSGGSPRALPIVNSDTPIILLCVIGIIAVCVVIAYFLARPLFFKMATKPFEYRKKIINHNYKINLEKEKIYEKAFRPKLQYPIKKSDVEGIVNKLSKLLRRINREEKIFLRRRINTKRVLKFLNKYSTNLSFEEVPLSEISDFGFIIQIRNDVPFLVLVKHIKGGVAHCYDPNHLSAKNHKHNSYITTLIKELLLDIRDPGIVVANFMLFIITPLAIASLNAIFGAINASFKGQFFTIMFNVLIIMLITLASNVTMASIYSREGNTSYMLKAVPVNYMRSLSTKLIIRGLIVTGSLIFTCFVYHYYSPVTFLRVDLLFFTFWFTYLGHLLWSAELDFMNPQDRLYSELGVNVNNPNETLSAVLTFIISLLFMGLTYFFVSTDPTYSFVRLLIVASVFFAARLFLFILKILGYGTSRSERRSN